MDKQNKHPCFADKAFSRCSILTVKNSEKCSFRKTIEQYKSDRLKYRDKEIAYLAKHGITYRGD